MNLGKTSEAIRQVKTKAKTTRTKSSFEIFNCVKNQIEIPETAMINVGDSDL